MSGIPSMDRPRYLLKYVRSTVASLLGTAPRRFAEILGKFLHRGGSEPNAENRILWATGTLAVHPLPLQQLFWDFQMPEDLMDCYGYHDVIGEIKGKSLPAT